MKQNEMTRTRELMTEDLHIKIPWVLSHISHNKEIDGSIPNN